MPMPDDVVAQLPTEYQSIDHAVMVQDTIGYTEGQLGGYFHKYFPRSYTETHDVFSQLLQFSVKYRNTLSAKESLHILDIGGGIGGNLIGLIEHIRNGFPNIGSVVVESIDGNRDALIYQQRILSRMRLNFALHFIPVNWVFTPQSMIPDLERMTDLSKPYDIIISSKFINEFYRKENGLNGLYSNFVSFSQKALDKSGITIITELTDKLSDDRHLNMIFNNETMSYFRNSSDSLRQIFPVPCHLWRDMCQSSRDCFIQQKYPDVQAKAFTQIFCSREFGADFYDSMFVGHWQKRPCRIKNATCRNSFCFQGRLYDDSKILPEHYY